MISRLTLAIACALVLSGCSSVSVEHYKDQRPILDLQTFLSGPLEAWGMFQKRDGTVVKRFHVAMVGRWKGDTGTLTENFTYADGTTSQRVWTLTRVDRHRYTGTAPDVEGTARGAAYGNAFNWHYTLVLPVDGDVYHVSMNDWMYLVDDHTLLNRATMTKFGFEVGQVTLFFRKPDGQGGGK